MLANPLPSVSTASTSGPIKNTVSRFPKQLLSGKYREWKKTKVEVSFLAITSKLTEENDPAVPNSFWIIPQVPASGTPEGVILIEWVTWYGVLGKSDLVAAFPSLFIVKIC